MQKTADGAASTIATHNVISLKLLKAIGRLDIDPGLVLVLAEGDNLVAEEGGDVIAAGNVLRQQLAQLVQGQCDQGFRVVVGERGIEAGKTGAVELPPAHVIGLEAAGAQVVADAGPVELGHGWRAVVGGARVLVELVALLDDRDGDASVREEESQDEARRPCADDNDLFA